MLVSLRTETELRPSAVFCLLILALYIPLNGQVSAWSNGGTSTEPARPKYGTHDFLAQHALDWVPSELGFWLHGNLATYLYGTELPDFEDAPGGDGIGDTLKHHVYFGIDGQVKDDSSARRAQESFDRVLGYLVSKDYANAAKWMGVTSHYIDDLAVFGHVMGKITIWGEERHHDDYETWVDTITDRYNTTFASCLSFDGSLEPTQVQKTAFAIAIDLAHDTTFDDTCKGHSAAWMDANYDTHDTTFRMRTCELLNHAVNAVADAIYLAAHTANIDEFHSGNIAPMIFVCFAIVLVAMRAAQSRKIN